MSDEEEDSTASGDDSEMDEDYVPGVDPDASDSELQRAHTEPSASAKERLEAAADKQQPEQENLGERDTEQPDAAADESAEREQSEQSANNESGVATAASKKVQKRVAFKKVAFKKSIRVDRTSDPSDINEAPLDGEEAEDAIEVADAEHDADDEDEQVVDSDDGGGDGDGDDDADEEETGVRDNDGGDGDGGDEQEQSDDDDEDEDLQEPGLTFDELEDRARAADQLTDELRVRICYDLLSNHFEFAYYIY